MKSIKPLLAAVDRFQQRTPGLAVAVGTWRKFSDDQAGNLAVLIAYYAFASIFPLLLVFVSILGIVLQNDAQLRTKLENTALHQYPVISQYFDPKHGLGKSGLALAIGLVLTFYGARGIATALQNAMNTVWEVPMYERPSFPWSLLRSFGVIAVIGPGEVLTITLSGVAGGTGHLGGIWTEAGTAVVAWLLNIGLFWLGLRLATAREIATRDLRLSAVIAATAWQILQLAGGVYVARQQHSNSAYGIFGVVLGLLAWFYLIAQITLYAVELTVVRSRRLWPRALFPPPLTTADVRSYRMRAQSVQPRRGVHIEVTEDGADQGPVAGPPREEDMPPDPETPASGEPARQRSWWRPWTWLRRRRQR